MSERWDPARLDDAMKMVMVIRGRLIIQEEGFARTNDPAVLPSYAQVSQLVAELSWVMNILTPGNARAAEPAPVEEVDHA
jgi:hypothetical protein